MKHKLTLLSVSISLVLLACAEKPTEQSAVANEQDKIELADNRQPLRQQPSATLPAKPASEDTASIEMQTAKLYATGQSRLKEQHVAADVYRIAPPAMEINRENYRFRNENGFLMVSDQPVSTFSIDVDTASYSNIRRLLSAGQLPPADAVRVEEFINYFDYQYQSPDRREQPFSVTTEIAPSPWAEGRHLLHIGLQGYDVPMNEVPPTNLVFLLDVSGSMNMPDKLPLLKQSLKMLSKKLRAQDKVSIVVYAGASGVVLEPVDGNAHSQIANALDRLHAGGSTNGAAGIQLAYQKARASFIKDGINRVILATDGDFNVGMTNIEQLKQLIKKQRDSGIELTTLGFGTGNYNDALMNELAEIGNGNASYIDNALEANKALVGELTSTLFTIAKDVKIQIEFSPLVAEYRLVGYESRLLNREDFNNDKKDAGEIGAGHSVTALYEVVLQNSDHKNVEPLRYHKQTVETSTGDNQPHRGELAFLKLRYKPPGEQHSILLQTPIHQSQITALNKTSENFRWSAAAAGFAQLLRGSQWTDTLNFPQVLQLAQSARGIDSEGYRAEMINLIKIADTLNSPQLSYNHSEE